MSEWQVLLITGPAGAGKTAAARRFAATRDEPTLYLSLDEARGDVLSGLANPVTGWDAEVARQYSLAQRSLAYRAQLYAAAGFKVVIDDAIFPEWEEANLSRWLEALPGLRHSLIVLMPSLEVTQTRNAERQGWHLLEPELITLIYEMMLPWKQSGERVIDNSHLTIEETVILIARDLEV